jgi:uncharacterized protein DUF4255
MNTALRALSLTLRELLRDRLRADPRLRAYFDPGHGGTMLVSLGTPEELESSGEGLSIWLYRLERDEFTQNEPPRRLARDRMLHQPLPMRAHYLITPIVNPQEREDSPELEQHIMGFVLQTLNDHATMRGPDLRFDLAGSALEIHIRMENLEIDQLARVWDALDASFQLCISYEASVVPIDSALQPAVVPPVDASMPKSGLATDAGEAP